MTKDQRIKLLKSAPKAMREAVKAVVLERQKLGMSLSVWRNGKVVKIPAKKLRTN